MQKIFIKLFLIFIVLQISACEICKTALKLKSKTLHDYDLDPYSWGETGPEGFSAGFVSSEYKDDQWVIMDQTHTVVAKCISGCPQSINWDQSKSGTQKWQVLENNKWADEKSTSLSCCEFAADPCDEKKKECSKYTTFTSCVFASQFTNTCCQAWGWVDTGKCLPAKIYHQCK